MSSLLETLLPDGPFTLEFASVDLPVMNKQGTESNQQLRYRSANWSHPGHWSPSQPRWFYPGMLATPSAANAADCS